MDQTDKRGARINTASERARSSSIAAAAAAAIGKVAPVDRSDVWDYDYSRCCHAVVVTAGSTGWPAGRWSASLRLRRARGQGGVTPGSDKVSRNIETGISIGHKGGFARSARHASRGRSELSQGPWNMSLGNLAGTVRLKYEMMRPSAAEERNRRIMEKFLR